MTSKNTDRKVKGKEAKSAINEPVDLLATFTLPESLPCSEIDFPVVVKEPLRANWKQIVEESEKEFRELQEYNERKIEQAPKSPFSRTECDYIKNEVFVYLIPALEEALNKARIWESFTKPKCFFNGIDHIVQLLWNSNPRHPERKHHNLHVFNMPWVRQYLAENPRPIYPKSWLWPEEYAATLIQSTVRQYFVQREEDVQEMREFWRKLKAERDHPELNTNPFLAKKFATT